MIIILCSRLHACMWFTQPPTFFPLQIRTRAISAKAMTLVSPLQLLLFGSKKVVSDGEIIVLDDWYELLADSVCECTGGR